MVKKLMKKIAIFLTITVTVILITAWAPWLTEDYAKDKVLNYFSQEYGFDENDIIITSIEKKNF